MADTKFFVQVITDAGLTPETELVFSHLDEMYVDPNGEYRFTIDATLLIARELNVRPSSFIVNRRELHVASGSEDWPDLSDLREEEIVLPDVVSNVDNGTGFIAGIASRKVPLESCFDDEDTQIACE